MHEDDQNRFGLCFSVADVCALSLAILAKPGESVNLISRAIVFNESYSLVDGHECPGKPVRQGVDALAHGERLILDRVDHVDNDQ